VSWTLRSWTSACCVRFDPLLRLHGDPPWHDPRLRRRSAFSSDCHDRPLGSAFFIGALVARRLLLCGLAAFILTLAFSLWHDGGFDVAPAALVAPQPGKGSLASTGAVPLKRSSSGLSTTPTAAAVPAATAMTQVIAPSEPVQSDPVDNDATPARRDRGAERGSRSH